MRILITGSTGFVGRYLVKLLENNNYQIHRIVRAKKGYPNEHIWDFSGNIPSYIPECEIIVHLAAYVDFGTSFNYEQYLVNTISTLRLLDYAKKYGSYLIFSSMAGVHGEKYEIVNEHTPISPENNYALSKYLAEEIIRIYHDNYTILRICGIYGIDGPSHLGLNTAIKNAVYYKKPPKLIGHGRAKRNYICVLDVAQWIFYLIEKYRKNFALQRNKINETLYIANTEVLTIKEYLQSIADVILKTGQIIKVKGSESKDFIVTPSSPPFNLKSFKEYLSLIEFNGKQKN